MKKIVISLLALAVVVTIAVAAYLHIGAPASAPTPKPVIAAPAAPATPTPPATPPAQIECVIPAPAPAMPDGTSATQDQMKASHDAVQAFVLRLEAYQACRDDQADHDTMLVTPAAKQRWIDEGDAAIDQAHAVADAFAAQLKIYKAKNSTPAAAAPAPKPQ